MTESGNCRTIAEILSEAESKLRNFSETPGLDAEILLAKVLNTGRLELWEKHGETIKAEEYGLFNSFTARRMNFEPVAYITNEKEFFEDTFFVDRRVLIPRPESEFIVEEAVSALKDVKKPKVLDICCGSGCIGLSIKRVTDCDLTLSDISDSALEVARINAKRLFPDKSDISFLQSDLFEKITGEFDLITANPPYLSAEDMKNFLVKDLVFEPENAFFGGTNGFEITERIIKSAGKFLKPGALFITELGYEGSIFLKSTISELKLLKTLKDYSGITRAAVFSL